MNVLRKILFSSFILSVLLVPFAQATFEFTDQEEIQSWAEPAVELVRERGIMTGFGDGRFGPRDILNRAEALAILLRAKGIDYKNNALSVPVRFSDVPTGQWYTKIVQNGVHQGWIKGFPDGTFKPGQSVNKAEFAVMVRRAFDLEREENPDFFDVPTNTWFSKAVFNLVANDLVRYVGDYFQPEAFVSRSEAAWIVSEIVQKPRLMGESAQNDFSEGGYRDSTKVAIKPRDFDADKQGLDVERKAIHVTAVPEGQEEVLLVRTGDWLPVGYILFENTLDDTAQLNSFELKLRFERTNIGPVSNFLIRVEQVDGPFFEEKEMTLGGTVFFGGLYENMKYGESEVFKVSLKPRPEQSFFGGIGNGWLSVYDVDGSTFSSFVSEHKESTGQTFAPTEINAYDLNTFRFDPTQ